MVLLGVVLVLLAAGAGVLLIAGTAQIPNPVVVEMLGGTLSFPPLAFLVTGMVVISLFWLGWAVLRAGLRHNKRRRAQAKEDAAAAEARRVAEEQRMQEELDSRGKQLAEERRLREQETAQLRQQTVTHPDQPGTPRP